MTDQDTYPMLSEKNWWFLRDKFKASLPSTVSVNYVKTMLDLSSDASANNNVILPMKRLGLIDDENKPTALANEWRIDDTYSAVCETIIKKVYPTELLDLFPGREIDRKSAKRWFMGRGVGDSTAGSMVALFALLKSGEIKTKQDRSISTPKKITQKPKPQKIVDESSSIKNGAEEKSEFIAQEKLDKSPLTRPNIHIDLQIHISPESTPEQIEAIFSSMAKHLYRADGS